MTTFRFISLSDALVLSLDFLLSIFPFLVEDSFRAE